MQKRKYFNTIFFSLLVIIPAVAFAVVQWAKNNYTALPYYGDNEIYNEQKGSEKNNEHYTVPPFAFTSQMNEPLTNAFTKNKIWVAGYVFTHCKAICPKISSNLQKVQDAFKGDDEVKIISFTVDPERDSAETLNSYASSYKADASQWKFATGDKKQLYLFARRGLFITATDGDGGPNDFIHSEKLVLVDKQNHIRGYYDGTDAAQVNQLVKDIQRLKKENN